MAPMRSIPWSQIGIRTRIDQSPGALAAAGTRRGGRVYSGKRHTVWTIP